MSILKVDRNKVVNEWGLPGDDAPELGVNILENKIVDHTRWHVVHSLVVEIKGKPYITSYRVGATEYQEERPWEYEDNVEFHEAVAVPKTVMVWEKRKDEETPKA